MKVLNMTCSEINKCNLKEHLKQRITKHDAILHRDVTAM
jgi:hypothetical protein